MANQKIHRIETEAGELTVITTTRSYMNNPNGFYARVCPPRGGGGMEPSKYYVRHSHQVAATMAATWYVEGKRGLEGRDGINYRTPMYGDVNDDDLEIGMAVLLVGGSGCGYEGTIARWDNEGHVWLDVDPSLHTEPIKTMHYDTRRLTANEIAERAQALPQGTGE